MANTGWPTTRLLDLLEIDLPIAPLRAKAKKAGSGDFSPLWSGQAAPLSRAMPAGELTAALAEDALARLNA